MARTVSLVGSSTVSVGASTFDMEVVELAFLEH